MRKLVTITDPADAMYPSFLEIYRESFPDAERQPENIIAERILQGKELLFLYVNQHRVEAIALLLKLEHDTSMLQGLSADYLLLDYFAVKKNCRTSGVGTAFFAILTKQISRQCQGATLVIEVEDPESGVEQNEVMTQMMQRRIRFYERQGAVISGIKNYRLPALGNSGTRTPMKIMIFPGEKLGLAESEADRLVAILFIQVYNQVPGFR